MKIKHPKSSEVGDTRVQKGFLLLPKRIDNETRWMEYAEWKEELVGRGGEDYTWRDEWWNEDEEDVENILLDKTDKEDEFWAGS